MNKTHKFSSLAAAPVVHIAEGSVGAVLEVGEGPGHGVRRHRVVHIAVAVQRFLEGGKETNS